MVKKQFFRIPSLILAVFLIFYSFTACSSTIPNDIVLDADSVTLRLNDMEDVPTFDVNLLGSVEICFKELYYTALPDNETLADGTKAAYFEFCKDVDPNSVEEVTYSLIDCYIYTIGDKYAFYRTSEEAEEYTTDMSGRFVGIGVSVLRNDLKNTILVSNVEPNSPAANAGILPNDYIVAVDGNQVSDIGAKKAVDMVRGEINTDVTVTVKRAEEEISFTITRDEIIETSVFYSFFEEQNIGYIKITGFKSNSASQFFKAVKAMEDAGVKGIIFDLRNNPGGYLSSVSDMLSYLVPTGTPIASFSSSKSPMYAKDGTIFETDDHVLTIPSVVICDETTASAAELFSAAMRDYNDLGLLKCTLVGKTTYKKGVMQSTYSFNDGSNLTLTTALYNPPSGENFNGIGVTPDVIADDSEDYIEKALEEIAKIIENN